MPQQVTGVISLVALVPAALALASAAVRGKGPGVRLRRDAASCFLLRDGCFSGEAAEPCSSPALTCSYCENDFPGVFARAEWRVYGDKPVYLDLA